jgi:VIT1/CCC1 family predicted Fe2+/Mn2+ transporter
MSESKPPSDEVREPVLDVVDRVSEMLFGLFMALTFVGVVSIAESGREEVRLALAAAFGCNLAWGLADAVMYLIRTVTARGKSLTLVRSVRAASPEAGRHLIERSLSRFAAGLVSDAEIEAMRGRIVALPFVPERPTLKRDYLLAAFAVFLIVVASTLPVALPFLMFEEVRTALTVSRGIAVAMLFFGGLALGRHAGYAGWKVGLMLAGLGTVLVTAIVALGG